MYPKALLELNRRRYLSKLRKTEMYCCKLLVLSFLLVAVPLMHLTRRLSRIVGLKFDGSGVELGWSRTESNSLAGAASSMACADM